MKWTGRFAGYNAAALRKDIIAGLIVGVIAIPLGMAFAIASGVKPEYGLYTTAIAGILIAVFGGSRFQIGGPTGAFIPIVLAIVMQYGYESLLIAGFMAGAMLVVMGLLRMGALIAYIPRPVTVGFTSGIAVVIFAGQIAPFLGLSGVGRHEYLLPALRELAVQLPTAHYPEIATALLSLAILLWLPRRLPKVPASLAALLISGVAASLLFPGQVATIGTQFGDIPSTLPQLHFPDVTFDRMIELLQPAFIIAMLGGIESLLSAVVADGMAGGPRHHSNRELIGQGIANMAVPLVGGIPATGAIARTAANIRSGAASPVSGIVHAVAVAVIVLCLGRYAAYIPLASMAPVLMVVAWNMSERRAFKQIWASKSADTLVLAITFLLTVLANLTIAVEAGMLLAVALFIRGMRQGLRVSKVLPDSSGGIGRKVTANAVTAGHDCPQFSIYTIEGPLFFGAATRLEQLMAEHVASGPEIALFRFSRVPLMDTSGEESFSRFVARLAAGGGQVLISGIQQQPLQLMKKTGLYERIGAAHFFTHTGDAINCGLQYIQQEKCYGCKHAAFRECASLSCVANSGRQEKALL